MVADNDAGSLSLVAALVLPSLLVASISVGGLLLAGETWVSRITGEQDARGEALETVEEALALLERDSSPAAHSRHDPLWRRGWPDTEVTEISAEVRSPREDGRLARSGDRYGFDDGYRLVNVNTASQERMLAVAAARLPAGVRPRVALERVFRARARGESFTPESLQLALSDHYLDLHPVLTARPPINANTAPRERLHSVLEYAGYAGNHNAVVSRIIAARRENEIDVYDLREMLIELGVGEPVLHLLGVRSQGARLHIEKRGRSYEAVIVWVPPNDGGNGRRWDDKEERGSFRLVRFAEVVR